MHIYHSRVRLFFVSFLLLSTVAAQKGKPVQAWLTSPAQNVFFKKQVTPVYFKSRDSAWQTVIDIDDTKRYQTINGFGFSLTGGSALNLMKMKKDERLALLQELFGTEKDHIGTSYLRISIGASDLDEKVFSYNDLREGEKDPDLKQFDLGYDKKYLLPVLKEILQINPYLKIMGSPWSPPVWMKNNNDTRGGNLLKSAYPVYARYFVKYIEAMRKEGIRIDAVTVQNEPLHPGNNPSLQMLANDQAAFVRDHLGPTFAAAKLSTKIIIYDHNADKPEYPITVLNDPEAKKYIDGSAFHLYGGTIDALSLVHDAHPDKNLYFTEQWVGAPGNYLGDISWHVENLVIGATRNWAKTVLEWNLASDEFYKPFTDRGGCTSCLAAVTIDQGKKKVIRNPAYYIIAHAAKLARPGSVRIGSNIPAGLPNVAFKTPMGKYVLVVLNKETAIRNMTIRWQNQTADLIMPANTVATYTW